jgi:hypothetical protein
MQKGLVKTGLVFVGHQQDLIPVFTPEELSQIQDYKARYQPLYIQDCLCLLLAENLSAVLLTGEKKLKTIATTSHGIQVHGVLWIFEH